MVIAFIHVCLILSQFVFKVFTHVQLSGSMNNRKKYWASNETVQPSCSHSLKYLLWSTIRTITVTILPDLYRKTQIVGRDPWENQKGLPSDWRQNQKTGKTQQEKKWKRRTQKFILEQGCRVGPMVLCQISVRS